MLFPMQSTRMDTTAMSLLTIWMSCCMSLKSSFGPNGCEALQHGLDLGHRRLVAHRVPPMVVVQLQCKTKRRNLCDPTGTPRDIKPTWES